MIVRCSAQRHRVAGVWRVNRNHVGRHQGPAKHPQVKSRPLPGFENKFIFETRPHSFGDVISMAASAL